MPRHFRYNINGNSALDMILAMDRLRLAALEMQLALDNASMVCVHGRNYLIVPNNEGDPLADRREDRRWLTARYREAESLRNDAEETMLELLKDPRVRRAYDDNRAAAYAARQEKADV